MFKGDCKAMESREETFTVHPTPTAPGAPREHTETIYRTVHGPVFQRGTVDGKAVAFVKERFFWKREVDSIPTFYRWNAETLSAKDFQSAAGKLTMSFNTFYVDSKESATSTSVTSPNGPRACRPLCRRGERGSGSGRAACRLRRCRRS